MDNKHIGLLAGVVAIFGLVVQYIPQYFLGKWIDGGFEGTIPIIGTVGQTVAIYNTLLDIVGPLLTIILAVSLGYYVEQRVDMAHDYRRVGSSIAVGSAVGVMLMSVPFMLWASHGLGTFLVFLLLASLGSLLVSVALIVTIGAFAGAAFSYFQENGNNHFRPTHADTTPSTGSQTKLPDEDSQTQSQSIR